MICATQFEKLGHKTGHRCDVLFAANFVGNHAARDRASGIEAIEHLSAGSIEGDEISGAFPGEKEARGGDGDAGQHWFRCVVAPALISCGSVESCEAAAGFFPGIEMREAAEIKIRVELGRRFVFLDHGAPIVGGFEERVGGGIVGWAAPFSASERAGANTNRVAERDVDIFAGDEWDRVELFARIAVNQLEEAVFAGGGDDIALLSLDRCREYGQLWLSCQVLLYATGWRAVCRAVCCM